MTGPAVPHQVGVEDLEKLEAAECWELVRSHSIGRFAVNRVGASPLVVPVNYSVEDGPSVVFRSGAGEKLDAATEGIVGIQVDEIDPAHHAGWSVLVEGSARWLYEDKTDVDVQPWAPGVRPYIVRITPTRVTGRRIRLAQADTDGRGYR